MAAEDNNVVAIEPARWQREPALISMAIEEIVRYDPALGGIKRARVFADGRLVLRHE